MPYTLTDFMAELEKETAAGGPAAVAEANILRAHYEFANRVYQARKKAGMTQQALAAASGIDQAEISRIELGESNPTMATMVRVLGALGLKLEFPAKKAAHPKRVGKKSRPATRYARRARR